MDARTKACVAHGYEHARCPSVAARYALQNLRPGSDRAVLCSADAAAFLRGMLGRRDLRCRHALPEGGPMVAAGVATQGDAEPVVADVIAFGQRCWIYQLPGQCGATFRPARQRGR